MSTTPFLSSTAEDLREGVVSQRARMRGIDIFDPVAMNGVREEFDNELNAFLALAPSRLKPLTVEEIHEIATEKAMAAIRDLPMAISAEEIRKIASDASTRAVAHNRPSPRTARIALGLAFLATLVALAITFKSTMDERELWGELAPTVDNVHGLLSSVGALETQMATLTTPPTIQAEETPAPTAAPTEDPVAVDARLSKDCKNYRWVVDADPAKGAVLIDCPDAKEHPCTTLNVAEGLASGCS